VVRREWNGSVKHRWPHNKKTVVEDCRQLDANRWMREKILVMDHIGSWNR
jgi:hypothetical protein